MLPLISDDWQRLHHAYDTAQDVPDWLRQLASGDRVKAMEKIRDNLFHQQTVYPATVAAVPHMVSIAQQLSGKWRLEVITFVGKVAAEDFRFVVSPEIQMAFETSLNDAAKLTDGLFETVQMDRSSAIDLLSATAALHGAAALGKTIFGFNGEFTTQCANCQVELYIWPKSDMMTVAAQDPVSSPETPMTNVVPCQDNSPVGLFPEIPPANALSWISSLATRAGDAETVRLLPYLFGTAACPSCHTEFNLVKRLTTAE